MTETVAPTPRRVAGFYDGPFWDSVQQRAMRLQCCRACGTFRYPAGPVCPECHDEDADWTEVGGRGTILSWVIYHRTYLAAYPAPYNVIAVRLDEGPVILSNLEGEAPDGDWIGQAVDLVYAQMPDGVVLPRFRATSGH